MGLDTRLGQPYARYVSDLLDKHKENDLQHSYGSGNIKVSKGDDSQ
jgi:hypothetical protein